MPLRRLNLDTNTLDGQRTPSSSTTTTPVSEQHHPSFAHDQIQIEMPPTTAPIPPPHMLGPPTSQAVSALAQAMQSGITRRLFQNVVSSNINLELSFCIWGLIVNPRAKRCGI